MQKNSRSAFSLIELMIVIVILGLLAAMAMPSLTGKGEEAKRNLVCVQMKSIYNASLDMFKLDNSVYPSTSEGLEALVKTQIMSAIHLFLQVDTLKMARYQKIHGAETLFT